MIEVSHIHLETRLLLEPSRPMLLIEENAAEFRETVEALRRQFSGGEGDFVFVNGDKRIAPSDSGVIVCDIFGMDLSDKKLTNSIWKEAEKNFIEGEYLPKLNTANAAVQELLQCTTYDFPFAVEYNELAVCDIFKAAGLRAAEHYESFIEKLICYTNLLVGLRRMDIMVFVNLKSVLTDEELRAFYDHCCEQKISLLLIESSKIRPLLPEERAVIITDDLCELVENFGYR